ncbi:hypothetical protein FSARC_14619 [Fusarium sarcochroum]|uniref:Amidase domain-containing protein n=1 Tax=Fusarium sarcochroum TaxID=1208366 RepID=A0A8H4WP14_9HYPO|nr:hypothetical protein FSARC_14619 [Fusarium sarcochroum]
MATWEVLAAAHREKQQQAIPPSWVLSQEKLDRISGMGTPQQGRLIDLKAAEASGLLTKREIEITECFTARELLRGINSQSLRSEDVVVAFCKRAAVAQQLTSCLTEIFFHEAIERARQLDTQLTTTGRAVGPLHGLPISLKDSFQVEGYHSTVGYVEFLKRPLPTGNAALVKLLIDAGAILYCKTNIPQTMMTADSENNIFGRTLNPNNTSLTAGGSTGGEGALVSFPLCCGIYGFKPTVDRIPFQGQALSPFPIHWVSSVMPSAGPLATSVGDLSFFMETITKLQPWKYDASAFHIPWRSLNPKDGPLTIGILPEDEEYLLHPPVRRLLAKAASVLEKAGHKLVRLPIDPRRSVSLGARIGYQFFKIASPDPATTAKNMGEPFVASVARGMHPFSSGNFPVSSELDIPTQFHKLNEARGAYAEAWKDTWHEYELDVVMAPGAVGTALPHDTFGIPVYTVMWNVLDYPAAVIPYGYASALDDPEPQVAKTAFVADCPILPCIPPPVVPKPNPSLTQVLFQKFLHNGLIELYNTNKFSWIQHFLLEMSTKSKSLPAVSAAIQIYLDGGGGDLPVLSMEYLDVALKTFRAELATDHSTFHPAIACAGILLCALNFLQAYPGSQLLRLLADSYSLGTPMSLLSLSSEDDLAIRHVLEFTGVMDLPCLVFGREKPSIGIWKSFRSTQDRWKKGRLRGIEIISGLPMCLLDIFADILYVDTENAVSSLWTWPGEVGDYLQCHLWDSWRLAGILDVRRRERCKTELPSDAFRDKVGNVTPCNEVVLCRLMAAIQILQTASARPENQHLLISNGLVFPLVIASLEVPLLKRHPEWKKTIDETRQLFELKKGYKLASITFQILDDAWQAGLSCFDLDKVARTKGIEIAVL